MSGIAYTQLSKIFLAYCAGLLDGEGNISITNNSPRGQLALRVCVHNTKPQVLYIIKDVFGGCIVRKKPKKRIHNVGYALEMCASGAENFIRKIKPYSIIKQEQIDLALKFRKTFAHYRRGDFTKTHNIKLRSEILDKRKEYKQQMGILNSRGAISFGN